jgi:hypothetical protein
LTLSRQKECHLTDLEEMKQSLERERERMTLCGQTDKDNQINDERTERKKLARRKNNSFKYLKRFRKYKTIDSQKLELA